MSATVAGVDLLAGTPLVYVETTNGKATPGSLGVLGRARQMSGTAAAAVFGREAAAVGAMLGSAGADVVFACDDPAVDPDLGGPHVDVMERLIRDHAITTVLFENSTVAADVAAGLAVRLDAGLNWDLRDLALRDGRLVGTRYALEDALMIEVGWTSDVRLGIFRLGTLEPADVEGAGRVERVSAPIATHAVGARIVERTASAGDRVDLSTADVIVAGGRGMRGRESLTLLEDLADALGGAVAVSMPIVDRGWYPHSRQVGQTGQKVRPRLYVACGISGQLAHRVGMERSRVVIAINTDATAPIFGMCDAGVVGDLSEIVPALAQLVRQGRATTGS